MKGWIWFDMDGTIVDLYSDKKWLEKLENEDVSLFQRADSLYGTGELVGLLLELKMRGFNIGIISWTPPQSSRDYISAVIDAKRFWLKERFLDYLFDKILITDYETPKQETCKRFGTGILVDDKEEIRNAWDLGETIDASMNIIDEIKKMIERVK
jgi:hypothetical protein